MTDPAHDFTLVFAGVEDWSDEDIERLFGICPDVVPVSRCGVASLGFVLSAPTIEDAIRSAMTDVRRAGLPGRIARVEIHSHDPAAV